MAERSQTASATKGVHFATLLVMALAPEEVGARIRKARIAKGWTHQRLADEMDVQLRTVQRWQKGRDQKTGKSTLPRLNVLMDLADLFDLPRSYFVETDDPTVTLREVLQRVGGLEEEVAALRRELRDEDDPEESPEAHDEPGEPPAELP